MLDSVLAELYQVTTGNLNLAVQRNKGRFPEDFMFQLTAEESGCLVLQIARANGRGGRRSQPYAFTELGVAMLSSVLKSSRAVQMNISIMRAFVRLREVVASHRELGHKVARIEARQRRHEVIITEVVDETARLRQPPRKLRRRIGFVTDGR
jgi:hypothetical protein